VIDTLINEQLMADPAARRYYGQLIGAASQQAESYRVDEMII